MKEEKELVRRGGKGVRGHEKREKVLHTGEKSNVTGWEQTRAWCLEKWNFKLTGGGVRFRGTRFGTDVQFSAWQLREWNKWEGDQ